MLNIVVLATKELTNCCVYFMRRYLYLFAILYVTMCGWNLGPNRVIWPYLHIPLPFLLLVPYANEWCPVHRWSGLK